MSILGILKRTSLLFTSSCLSFFQQLHFATINFFEFPVRGQLPQDLDTWRGLLFDESDPKAYTKTWDALKPFFERHGFTLWSHSDELNEFMRDLPGLSNYASIPASTPNGILLQRFGHGNGLFHAVRRNKQDYVLRVMSVSGEDLEHLRLMRLLSAPPDILLSNNHILPMVMEIAYEDIIFGVFPRLGDRLANGLFPTPDRNTIEDSLYLVMQALEAVIYIHGKNIAHRDLFFDNFMTDWRPQSLLGQDWTRPRVYLIDFETAVHFSDNVDPSNRLSSGLPVAGSYARDKAPELQVTEPLYCPFCLDMWQFGFGLVQMLSETGVEQIDTLWAPLMSENPADRPSALEVFQKLGDFISTTPPRHLQRGYRCSPIYI